MEIYSPKLSKGNSSDEKITIKIFNGGWGGVKTLFTLIGMNEETYLKWIVREKGNSKLSSIDKDSWKFLKTCWKLQEQNFQTFPRLLSSRLNFSVLKTITFGICLSWLSNKLNSTLNRLINRSHCDSHKHTSFRHFKRWCVTSFTRKIKEFHCW